MIVTNLKVVQSNAAAATVVEADERGLLDSAGRINVAWEQVNYPLNATPVAQYIWRCFQGVWVVEYVNVIVRVTGSTGATVDVLVCQQVEAVASGVSQLGAVMDVEETAPFQATPALIATPTEIYPGDSVAVNYGGTATGLIGLLTVILKRTK
jgi:hypothetical protein